MKTAKKKFNERREKSEAEGLKKSRKKGILTNKKLVKAYNK